MNTLVVIVLFCAMALGSVVAGQDLTIIDMSIFTIVLFHYLDSLDHKKIEKDEE